MQPKRFQGTTSSAPAPAFGRVRLPGAAPGTSPAADLQQLIQAHYGVDTDAGIGHAIPLPARIALMLSMSAALWAGIALAVRLAIG